MNYYRWNVYVNLLIELKGKKNDHSIFQPPWTDNNPLARMTHISAQWSYFPRFEAKSEISLSLSQRRRRRSESRTGGLEPDGRKCKWIGRGVDRGGHGSVKRKEGERGQPVCTRRPKEENGFWPRSTKVKRPSRERTRPGVVCIWAPLNQWPSYENRSLFTASLREPPTWSTLATLASFLDDICICVSQLESGILRASWTQSPSGYLFCHPPTIDRRLPIFSSFLDHLFCESINWFCYCYCYNDCINFVNHFVGCSSYRIVHFLC